MIDANLVLSDEQAITTTALSTNKIDLGPKREYMGEGDDLVIHCVVAEDFAGGTSLVAALQGCDTEGGTYGTLLMGPTVATANLTKGKSLLSVTLPKAMLTTAGDAIRFLQMNYTVVGTMTAGKVSAYIDLQTAKTTPRRMVS